MKAALLEQLLADRAAKRPAVLATRLEPGDGARQHLVHPLEPDAGDDAPPALVAAARRALELGVSGATTVGEGGAARAWFLQVHDAPLRLVVVGAVHTAQALAQMAALAGYEVVVVDPREAFANEARFPGVRRSTEWPDDALAALAPDHRTAVVTLTHDPKLDDPALVAALRSDAFYVGCLGSRRTHAARLERLRDAHGLDDAALARLHGPVGLAIGARSPAEIAVSIVAEMTQVLRAPAEAARREARGR